MATALSREDLSGATLVRWTGLANSEAGEKFSSSTFGDRCVQFGGTFGGATVVLQGSNDGETWFTLTDPQGNAISATANAMEQVMERPRYMRPSASGGGGSTAVNVILFAARSLK